MAARGIRDSRMGGVRPHIKVAKPLPLGRPVMSRAPMEQPVAPANLRPGPGPIRGPAVSGPALMPNAVAGPQPVNPAGPMNVGPTTP